MRTKKYYTLLETKIKISGLDKNHRKKILHKNLHHDQAMEIMWEIFRQLSDD